MFEQCLPDVMRLIMPWFCISSVFLVFLKSLVFCGRGATPAWFYWIRNSIIKSFWIGATFSLEAKTGVGNVGNEIHILGESASTWNAMWMLVTIQWMPEIRSHFPGTLKQFEMPTIRHFDTSLDKVFWHPQYAKSWKKNYWKEVKKEFM